MAGIGNLGWAARRFESLDYNNQRNVLWAAASVKSEEQCSLYIEMLKEYGSALTETLGLLSARRLSEMATKLTLTGRKTKLADLISKVA